MEPAVLAVVAAAILAFGAAGGAALGRSARGVCERLRDFGEAEGQLLTLLVFLIFGALMVPDALARADGRIFAYALLSLAAVRMAAIGMSLLGSGLRPFSVAFLGWFGPRGLASILFALVVVEGDRLEAGPLLVTVATLTVALSTLLHGVSAAPLSRLYGERCQRMRDRAPVEHQLVSDLPLRGPGPRSFTSTSPNQGENP